MSFDHPGLVAAVERLGPLVRVLIAETAGSAPREAGCAMLVAAETTEGTIGGGALEWAAIAAARDMLAAAAPARVMRLPLGPGLGQCCGGAVVLALEPLDAARLAAMAPRDGLALRAIEDRPLPLALRRLQARARAEGQRPARPLLQGGWLAEPAAAPARPLWIWGAGHVGRALVEVLRPLPDFALTWVDDAAARFPGCLPPGVTCLHHPQPGTLVAAAPDSARHLVLTYSHALDLELCHRLLGRPTAGIGLIGSATKWARFRSRLRALGHADARIMGIDCPIGDPGLGKHPQAIAVGVAVALLRPPAPALAGRDDGRERGADRAGG